MSDSEESFGYIASVFWRKITAADLFNIERSRNAGPTSGGGQLYIDIPLGRGVSTDEFGKFLNGQPLDSDPSTWETIEITVHSLSLPDVGASLSLTPRRGANRRYRIANQNRQATGGNRHPAWTAERGFPSAPDEVASRNDPRMPDVSVLKIFIARTDRGEFFAHYTNSTTMPENWPKVSGLDVLFQPNSQVEADGIIQIPADSRLRPHSLGEWTAAPPGSSATVAEQAHSSAQVVLRSIQSRRSTTGNARSGSRTSRVRPDVTESVNVDAPRSSEAEDWVEDRLRKMYGQDLVQRYGHTDAETIPIADGFLPGADLIVLDPSSRAPQCFVEVKSSSGSVPRSIRLTATELQRARKCAIDEIPYDIWIVVFNNALVDASIVHGFEKDAALLTIEDAVSVELQITT